MEDATSKKTQAWLKVQMENNYRKIVDAEKKGFENIDSLKRPIIEQSNLYANIYNEGELLKSKGELTNKNYQKIIEKYKNNAKTDLEQKTLDGVADYFNKELTKESKRIDFTKNLGKKGHEI